MIGLVHLNFIEPVSRESGVLRLTTANAYTKEEHSYAPSVSLGGLPGYSQSLYSRGTTGGEVTVSSSDLYVNNADGRYDFLRTYGVVGQAVEVYLLENEKDTPSESNLYFRGTVSGHEYSLSEVVFKVSGRTQELDVPVLDSSFLGNNEGPEGLEGTESTLKGKIKPAIFGLLFNFEPYQVNSSLLVYGLNYKKDGTRAPVYQVRTVRDKGGLLLNEGDVSDAESLLAADISEGYYKTCLEEGLIRLGSVPQGSVTVDVAECAIGQASAAMVVRRMLEDYKGYVAGVDFDAYGLNYLHALNSWPVGLELREKETFLSAIAAVLDSVGGWFAFDSKGIIRFGRLEHPDGLGLSADLGEHDFKENSLQYLQLDDEGKGVPAHRFSLRYGRNWSTMSQNEILESVSQRDRNLLTQEYLSIQLEEDSVKLVHPTSKAEEKETLLSGPTPHKLRAPEFGVGAEDSWYGAQLSGIGGSCSFGGVLNILSTLGTFGVYQELTSSSIFSGRHRFSLYLVSGEVTVGVTADSLDLGSSHASTPGLHSLDFEVPAGATSVVFEIKAINSDAEVRYVDLTERLAGPTPEEECERIFDIKSKTQSRFKLTLPLLPFRQVEVGDAVRFTVPRFQLDEGKPFFVIGRDDDLGNEEMSVDLWRPNDY